MRKLRSRRCLLNTTPTNERPSELIAADSGFTAELKGDNHTPVSDDVYEEDERGPLRRCLVTRERLAPSSMIRFVVAPDKTVVPDLDARLPGRGIWLSARRDVLETARTRGGFARAARCQVIIPSDLVGLIEAGLLRRVTDTLGLARRAGQAVCGYAKVREWIVAGTAGLVVQASDGSPDECVRLLSGARSLPVVKPLDAAQLGKVFGREHTVHAALRTGALADRLKQDSKRFAGLADVAVLRTPEVSGERVEQADR